MKKRLRRFFRTECPQVILLWTSLGIVLGLLGSLAFRDDFPTLLNKGAIIAAAAATLVAAIQALATRKSIALVEKARLPDVKIAFDLESRHRMTLIRLCNIGGNSAHNVCIKWEDKPIYDHNGAPIMIDNILLLPGESISKLIHVSAAFFQQFDTQDNPAIFRGTLTFKDDNFKKYTKHFVLDGEKYRGNIGAENDYQLAWRAIEKLPECIDNLTKVVKNVSR